jgi:hypothetical protein
VSSILVPEPLEYVPAWLGEHDDSAAHAEAHLSILEQLAVPLAVPLTAPKKLTPTQKKKARGFITNYCVKCEAHERTKHYSQHRPMTHLGDSPEQTWYADCSGYVTSALYWADKWGVGFKVEDPNGLDYSGWGYTGTLLSHNFRHQVPLDHNFYVGDIGLYGPASRTRHTVICRKGGNISTAIWSSFGSERGPIPVRLRYRSDVLCVLRPWSLL